MLADSLSYPSRPACPPWWWQPPPPGWTGTRGSGPSAPGLWSPPSPGCPRGLDGDTMSWIVLVTAFWRSGGVVQIKITDCMDNSKVNAITKAFLLYLFFLFKKMATDYFYFYFCSCSFFICKSWKTVEVKTVAEKYLNRTIIVVLPF